MKKIFAIAVSLLLAAPPVATGAAYDPAGAKNYLTSKNASAWTTMALAAAGEQAIPVEHLKNISSGSAIDYTAPILALAAANRDPRSFGSEDYVAKLSGFYSSGQIGDPATLNDDIFGLLALAASGEKDSNPVVSGTKNYLLSQQNGNGGWGFAAGGAADSNMTSAAILALISAGLDPQNPAIQNALSYLKTAQNDDGGFTYDPASSYGTSSDSSSTAWVIWALNALGISPSSWSKSGISPASYLESNQAESGYFKYQQGSAEDSFSPITTAYAVIALSGKFLPVKTLSAKPAETFDFRIEGSRDTVCEGKAAGPAALDVIKNAQAACGYNYEIKNTSFGPYLSSINGDAASGMTGWIYLVNYSSPSVGAADYLLQKGDTLLWYYGDFNWKPSRLVLSQSETASGQPVQAAVESYENGSWIPLEGASVYAGTSTFTSDGQGKASLSLNDGYYRIYAEKEGFVRTGQVLLKTGQPSGSAVSLKVNIGQVEGESTTTPENSVSLIVEPGNLDFGTLSAGLESKKTITIKNSGTTSLQVEAVVEGGGVFKDHLAVQGKNWKNYKASASPGQSQSAELKLSIPPGYSAGAGPQTGQIIFWAAPSSQ